MAHLIFATQGIQHCIDQFKNDLQAQFFPWPWKEIKTGKWREDMVVQGALRPIQLWMYVYPKGSHSEVCNTIGITKNKLENMRKKGYKRIAKGGIGKLSKEAIRKALGAKKIPAPDPNVPGRMIRNHGVSIFPIGYRDDKFGEHAHNKGWKHELL